METARRSRPIRRIRIWLSVVIAAMFISGVTAFPLETELRWIVWHVGWVPLPGLVVWLERVYGALAATNRTYPFLAYGTDWLAFAHLALAILFIGPWRDPIRNKWVVEFGLIACGGVLLLALIAGPVRGIPLYWQLIDCSFGVFAAAAALSEGYQGARARIGDEAMRRGAAFRASSTSYIQLSQQIKEGNL